MKSIRLQLLVAMVLLAGTSVFAQTQSTLENGYKSPSSDDNRDALQSIITKARARFARPKCTALIGSLDVDEWAKKYVSVGSKTPKGNDFIGPYEAARTVSFLNQDHQRIAMGRTVFSENSFFFTGKIGEKSTEAYFDGQKRADTGVGILSVDKILELIVIHEMVHAGDVRGRYDDGERPNKELNSAIRKNCFGSYLGPTDHEEPVSATDNVVPLASRKLHGH